MPKNRNLLIIALIALVNMLGYGIIIPILYSYSKKFGLTDFQNGLLFAVFSACQFVSTPIIGRMSDKFGRRPLLIISILGTVASFFTMAFAPSYIFLFLARAIDGLTAGNIPVIFAVISDTTENSERPKAFGLVGAASSFGFVFGPAISAFTLRFGLGVPFIIAGIIATLAVILTILFLPETNIHMGEVKEGRLFDFGKLWHTLFDPNIGATLLISLVFTLAFACAVIYGFQPFTLNVLHISAAFNASLFTIFGMVGLLTQTFVVSAFTKKFGLKKSFKISMFTVTIAFILMFLSGNVPFFVFSMILLSLANNIAQTLIPTIISQETDSKSQGTIMGLNASYQSIGMIIGPILGGAVATFHATFPFITGSILTLICFLLTSQVLKPGIKKESEF